MNDKFRVTTENFKGPLEALLDLIESRKLSISEISLAEVTDAFLAYVESLPSLPLGETSQFILVASTLLLIKSRSLLPTLTITDEEETNIHELEKRLAQLAIIRRGSKELRKIWGTTPLLFPEYAPARAIQFAPGNLALSLIAQTLRKLVNLFPKPEILIQATVQPILKLEEVVEKLRARVKAAWKSRFSDFARGASRADTIVYFLAMLELVRSGSVSVTQDSLFSEITLEGETNSGVPSYGN